MTSFMAGCLIQGTPRPRPLVLALSFLFSFSLSPSSSSSSSSFYFYGALGIGPRGALSLNCPSALFICYFELGAHWHTQAGLKLAVLPSLPSSWDRRCAPPCPARMKPGCFCTSTISGIPSRAGGWVQAVCAKLAALRLPLGATGCPAGLGLSGRAGSGARLDHWFLGRMTGRQPAKRTLQAPVNLGNAVFNRGEQVSP